MSDSDGSLGWFGQEEAPIRAKFGTHFCIYCGHPLTLEIRHCEDKFYDIKKVYRFCCSKCKKIISPITQLSYEDNEKLLRKIYKQLLKYAKPEHIIKVWLDKNNNILEIPDIKNLNKILFLVNVNGIEFEVPCSKTIRSKLRYEHPIRILKDRDFKKAYSALKKYIKSLNER